MKDFFRKIKYAYQRVRYGVDETFMWEMDTYLEYYFVPKIKEFCIEELKNKEQGEPRLTIYSEMLKRIEEFEKMDYKDFYLIKNSSSKIWSHFGEHIGYFWN